MSFFNRLTAVLVTAAMFGSMLPLEARTRKGDKYLLEGRAHEDKKEWDGAMESYEKALSEDPGELVYQMAAQKARFQASQAHVDNGLKIRAKGLLGEAFLEFQKAYAINPGSSIAELEVLRTQDMIQRERKRVAETGKEGAPEVRALTPTDELKKANQEKIRRILPVPELRPLDPTVHDLTMNSVSVKTLFDTVGRTAGLNVLWDPEFVTPQKNILSVRLDSATVEDALDYLAVITKSYWKPLSPNTIFITNDNPNKRRDYAEMVAQTFYLSNVSMPQEIQEIVNAVRSVSELQRVVAYNAQNAIIVRGEADQVTLAGKMIRDLDKPKSEVVVDIMVLEASTVFSRQLTAAIASAGLTTGITYNPRNSIPVTPPTDTGTGTPTTTPATGGSTTGSATTINQLSHLSTADFAVTLPSALLQAVLSDTKTKTLQAPQIRHFGPTECFTTSRRLYGDEEEEGRQEDGEEEGWEEEEVAG